MAKVLGIVQVKGGAGRSTIATNLAAVFSTKLKIALVDCDMPQGTSASWFATRKAEDRADNLTIATVKDHQDLVDTVKHLKADHDLIVIDAPPRIAEVTRAILILSDLNLIPLGASAAEIWATSDLLDTIQEAKQYREQIDARVLWTRFRNHTRSARELSDAVKDELQLSEMETRLGYRVAYSEALARGLGVHEWPDKAARNEMTTLGNELIAILRKK